MSSESSRKRKVAEEDRASGVNAEEDEAFRGVTLETDAGSSAVVALTTGSRRDQDRWDATTPSFDAFPDLQKVDLYKCRYLESVHESLVQLKHLKTLRLTRCSRLKSIPDSIGRLENLEEVSYDHRLCCV